MNKNQFLHVLIILMKISLYGQIKCTPLLEVKKYQDRMYYDNYEYTLKSSLDLHFNIHDSFKAEDTEFFSYQKEILYQLLLNFRKHYENNYSDRLFSFFDHSGDFLVDEIYEENVDYLIEIKYSTFKSKKNKRVLFKDGHKDYYQYIPLSGDTLRRGRLAETYQKYNSVLIGTHTWYKYQKSLNGEVERVIERRVNYDDFYPVCWSNAIKRARRKGIKAKNPELIAPIGYPNIKLEKGEAFWLIRDGVNEVKIDAYLQD